MYLKITKHEAHPFDGTEAEAIRLASLIGNNRANAHYMSHKNVAGDNVRDFSGKIEIFGRNGVTYVHADEVLMHDVESNEWFSVTFDQFQTQYRPFAFSPKCGDGPTGVEGPTCAAGGISGCGSYTQLILENQ